jgi:IclR family KDG regulon transcriptional repressor
LDKKTRVQSVSRACMILQLLGVKKNGLSTTEISDHMNLNRSTTHHLISTLQDHNFVKLNADNKYCLSSALHELVNQAPKNTLINIAHGILVDVVNATDETTYFSIFQDGVISLDIILGTGALRVVQAFPLPGEPQNLHARASGKLYLSTLGTKELEKYIEENSLKSLANKKTRVF